MGHYRKNVVSIFFNDDCNMRCIYCPLHAKDGGFYSLQKKVLTQPAHPRRTVIDLEFAKRGVADFFAQTGSCQVRLFSNGEATLAFDAVREVTDYARALAGDRLYIELQSNGCFGPKVAKWVIENVDVLWLSLDGTSEIQDYQRPGPNGKPTFATIDANIRQIQQSGRPTIGLRSTVSTWSNWRQRELVDYARERGIGIIYAYPWVSFLKRREGMPDLMEFADAFLEARQHAEEVGVYYGTVFMINFDEEVEINCRALLPAPHLTPDGYVTCCDMQNAGDGLMEDLVYGKWDPARRVIDYYPERIEKIRSRNIHNLPHCAGCPALKHCAGGCVGAGILSSGLDFYGVNREYCEVTKYLFRRLAGIVNRGHDPRVLLHP